METVSTNETVPTTVLHSRPLSADAVELRLKRPEGFCFNAGELVTLHGKSPLDRRDYTIASGEDDPFIDVLYRVIAGGSLTPQLAALESGGTIHISGPLGTFTIRDRARPMVFIATGTGIAPCRSYLRSHPELDVTVFHGVRTPNDRYYHRELFEKYRYHPCISRPEDSTPKRRVTDALREAELDINAHYYLCGANEMFYDVHDLLTDRGIPAEQIFAEAYYYKMEN